MNVNFEKNGNVDGIITITLAESDYAEKVNKELSDTKSLLNNTRSK